MARLGPTRLAALGAVGIGLLAFFVFMTGRLSQEEMAVLYSDLDSADSGKVVTKLEGMNVPYELSRDGTRILVPASRAARLRMAMAEENLISGGSLGYEIFDKGSLRGATQLQRQEVMAIQNLVASAVPKLSTSRVSIIDDRGNLLARGGEENVGSLAAVTAQEMRTTYERRLARTIEELLERSLGFGRVRAEIAVEMDFDRVTTNSETFDPEQQVVRSTQTISDNSQSNDGQKDSGVSVANNLPDAQAAKSDNGATRSEKNARQEETVNYEISKTIKTHVRESGSVRRVTAAVLVDGRSVTDANGATNYEARSPEEMEKLAALVRSAIGFDAERGDKVEIVNMQFARPDEIGNDGLDGLGPLGLEKSDIFRIAEMALLGIVGILVLLLVVRPLMARLLDNAAAPAEAMAEQQMLIAGQPQAMAALTGPSAAAIVGEVDEDEDSAITEEGMINVKQVEGRVKASSVKRVGEIIERHPDEAVGILRHWMYQDA